MTWIYWAGFLVYAFLVLFIGWSGYKKQPKSTDNNLDFWAAGKSLNSWSSGLSISASFMSISWSCVYDVQLFYWYGISALWLLAIPWLIVMLVYYFLVPFFRKLPAFSQPEMLAQKFGDKIRLYFALPLALVFLVWAGAEIFAAAQILSPILNINFQIILALVTVIVAGYSYLGGFSAVVMTDKLQYALVAFFIISIAAVSGHAVLTTTDVSGFLMHIPNPPKTNLSPFALFAAGPVLIVLTLIAYLPGWIIETDIWLRLQASRSNSDAKKGVIISSINSILFIAVFPLFIGLAALYLYPPSGAAIPSELNDGAAIFAVLIRDHSPTLLSVFLVIGLSAASMSTIDTCSNVMALSLSYDILEPRLSQKNATLKMEKPARMMSAGAVFLAYIYALFTDSLWDIFYLSSGILTTTIFIPLMALLFFPATSRSQVKYAAVSGFLSTLLFYFLESRGYLVTIEPSWLSESGLGYILWGLLFCVVGFFLGKIKSPVLATNEIVEKMEMNR